MKSKLLVIFICVLIHLSLVSACSISRTNKDGTGETKPVREYILDVAPLKEIYADYFLVGNIVNPPNIAGSTQRERDHYDALKHHYNALTFENDMKPDHMWGPGNVYTRPSEPANRLAQVSGWLKTLTDDGFVIIGHTLAWHSQSPNWLNLSSGHREGSPAPVYKPYAEAHQNLNDFIDVVAGYFYKNPDVSVYSWDVLNEVISPQNGVSRDEENWGRHATGAIWSPQNPWRSPWYICYETDAPDGVNPWDYVYDAFYFARQADPSAILMYNDYNMETPAKVDVVISMVNALNKQYKAATGGSRNLIEAIGMQTHIGTNHNLFQFENAIVRYHTETGLNVSITELDVAVDNPYRPAIGQPLSQTGEIAQARVYARLFQILKRHHEYIDRVSWWGLHDGRHWLAANTFPHLFTSDLYAKEAYYAVADPDSWLEANEN